ncbi:hypothetical protein FKW77_003052 [Venturia effusa]|uniref:Uncharacterized protein n=1 Tax=Venturia effusa TaxID=50376 RepID=A0A517L2W2_9PEZI|nr:hypothetical protein FKW77_003052 [Venturia effusa]
MAAAMLMILDKITASKRSTTQLKASFMRASTQHNLLISSACRRVSGCRCITTITFQKYLADILKSGKSRLPKDNNIVVDPKDITMDAAEHLVQRLTNAANAILPPRKRDAVINVLHDFAYVYPKLAAFLFLNVLLTSIPFLCFAAFVLTVFVSSLATAVLGAILLTLLITGVAVFAASLLLLPVIFCSAIVASTLYFWILAGYFIFAYLKGEGVASSDNAVSSKPAVYSSHGERGHIEDGDGCEIKPSKDSVALKNAIPSSSASLPNEAVPLDGTTSADEVVYSTELDHSDIAIKSEAHLLTGGTIDGAPRTITKPANRPKVEPKDSAIGFEELEDELGQRMDPLASVVYNGTDVDPHLASLAESIRSDIASEPSSISMASKSPRSRKSSRKSAPSTPPATTGAGQPVQFAHLRGEHPEGLRQDSKGLFKVDDIASDSSLEEANRSVRSDGNRPLRKRSASSFTPLSRDQITALNDLEGPHLSAMSMYDTRSAPQGLRREKTAFHLPTNAEPGKLNTSATISPITPLPMPKFEQSSESTKVEMAKLKEAVNLTTRDMITTPVEPNTDHADIEDNCDDCGPSSGKSSDEINRLVEDTTSADEMDFANMPSTPEDERDTIIKSSISPYTGEIVGSYFDHMDAATGI